MSNALQLNIVLEKRTHFFDSVSLTREEFEELRKGSYSSIRVCGPTGRFIKLISLANILFRERLLARAKLLQTSHKDADGETRDPEEQVWYWVLNLR